MQVGLQVYEGSFMDVEQFLGLLFAVPVVEVGICSYFVGMLIRLGLDVCHPRLIWA